mmetsp:Transcript_19016/g.47861  ORF Transcript_19016/g.47861 Transcript_19016/m.47861 type:complete len:207 (-) Transcript_19016:1031-1651(-)
MHHVNRRGDRLHVAVGRARGPRLVVRVGEAAVPHGARAEAVAEGRPPADAKLVGLADAERGADGQVVAGVALVRDGAHHDRLRHHAHHLQLLGLVHQRVDADGALRGDGGEPRGDVAPADQHLVRPVVGKPGIRVLLPVAGKVERQRSRGRPEVLKVGGVHVPSKHDGRVPHLPRMELLEAGQPNQQLPDLVRPELVLHFGLGVPR